MTSAQPDHEALLRHVARRLSHFAVLRRADLDVVERLGETLRLHPRSSDVTPEGGEAPRIVLSGWACHVRPSAGGKRQIFGFVIPGDAIGSFWRQPEYTFHRTIAMTRLGVASAQSLVAVNGAGALRHPTLVEAARRAEDHAQHLLMNHITRLGARDAYGGLAHLLLELHHRLDQVGLARDGAFWLPLGQRVLAQAMGFSLAHTNHTLQRMTADGLFQADDDMIRLLQPERMAVIADFHAEAAIRSDQAHDINPTLVRTGGHHGHV